MQAICLRTGGQVVPIDGKTLKRSYDWACDKAAIHMVSAWAEANSVVLGQIKTNEKSNEITAIPELLRLLDIEGCLVTIDAIGCQKAIAAQVVEQGGDYLLALKANQGQLYEDVRAWFEYAAARQFKGMAHDYFEDIDAGHGRIETRRAWATDCLEWLEGREAWAKLTTVVMVESLRERSDTQTTERRFYISSAPCNAAVLGQAVRAHWGIESVPQAGAQEEST
jgi:predicted transposase YbfD/YdcC